MKKTVLRLSLALATLGLLTSPAITTAQTLNAVDQAFLSSLALPVTAPAPAVAATGLDKALCTASAHCWDGSTVSCQGNNSTTSCTGTDSNCSVGQRGSVNCDGNITLCPACPSSSCTSFCAAEREACASDCYPCGFSFTCSSSTPPCTRSCKCKFSTCF